jgi:hypothetical protein
MLYQMQTVSPASAVQEYVLPVVQDSVTEKPPEIQPAALPSALQPMVKDLEFNWLTEQESAVPQLMVS